MRGFEGVDVSVDGEGGVVYFMELFEGYHGYF